MSTISIPTSTTPAAGTYTLDLSHSSVEFSVRHMMVSKTKGRFSEFSADVHIADDPLASWVTADIDLASLDTGDAKRDEHLKGSDFFDIERFPKMSFRSTSISEKGSGSYVLAGELTVRGVTRPVTLDLEYNGAETAPWGGSRIGFTATGEVNRKDFGLEWNVPLDSGGFLVGDKAKLTLEIEAFQPETPAS